VVAVALAGCATADPRGAFDATAGLVAGRHPGELAFRPDSAAEARLAARRDELLAAPLTAEGAVELALAGNPFLRARLEELGVAQADLAQASRLANPGVGFARLSGDGERQTSAHLAADVVDWLTQPLRTKVAVAELERTKLEVGDAILELALEARRAFHGYQAAAQLASRLEQIAAIDRAAAEFAAALRRAGNATALELAGVEASLAETRAELARGRAEAARRREQVARVSALAADAPWSAAPLGAPEPVALEPAALADAAARQRLDLAAARWNVDAVARALALRRRTRFFPVGVELGVERERETDGVRLTGPTVELRLPVFDTGKASVARLESELARARWQLAGVEAVARSEVREKAGDLAAAAELAALYRDALLPRRLEVLDGTLREYNAMLVGVFDLLTAKRLEIEAEKGALDALAAYWVARAELERALGGPIPAPRAADPEPSPTAVQEPSR
jgi:cobalt-zinc-cadmium efflux system outer membrane protein